MTVGWIIQFNMLLLTFLSRLRSSFSIRFVSFSDFISSQASIPSVRWQDSGTTLATRIAPPGGKGLLIMCDFHIKLISEFMAQQFQKYSVCFIAKQFVCALLIKTTRDVNTILTILMRSWDQLHLKWPTSFLSVSYI